MLKENGANLEGSPPKVPSADAHLSELKAWFERSEQLEEEASQAWLKAWVLSLSVGNGAGLLTLGAALINGWKLGVWLAIVPGLWAFAIGICAAGLAPLVRSTFHDSLRRHSDAMKGWIENPADRAQLVAEAEASLKDSDLHIKSTLTLVTVSSVSFLVGIFWPLCVVTAWLFNMISLPSALR